MASREARNLREKDAKSVGRGRGREEEVEEASRTRKETNRGKKRKNEKRKRKIRRKRERERHLLEEWAGLVRSEEDGENSWNHDVDGARRLIQSAKEKENTRELEGGGRACPELPRGVYRPFDLCRSSLLPRSIDTSYFYGWSQP